MKPSIPSIDRTKPELSIESNIRNSIKAAPIVPKCMRESTDSLPPIETNPRRKSKSSVRSKSSIKSTISRKLRNFSFTPKKKSSASVSSSLAFSSAVLEPPMPSPTSKNYVENISCTVNADHKSMDELKVEKRSSFRKNLPIKIGNIRKCIDSSVLSTPGIFLNMDSMDMKMLERVNKLNEKLPENKELRSIPKSSLFTSSKDSIALSYVLLKFIENAAQPILSNDFCELRLKTFNREYINLKSSLICFRNFHT